MFFPWSAKEICLFGRWDRSGESAATVNTGSTVTFRFRGRSAVIRFDTRTNRDPAPHLWIELGGVMVETPVTEHVHIRGTDGENRARVIVKSADEAQHRWYQPLEACVRLLGVEAEELLPQEEDRRPIVEFIGDSITEGILIEPERRHARRAPGWPSEAEDRVYQDDVTLDYSWLSAEKAGARARVIGFGAVGATHAGSGSVPRAAESYPMVYDGVAAQEEEADAIVINHGANDRGATDGEYAAAYRELLEAVRDRNPACPILCMSAFVGSHAQALSRMIAEYNLETGDCVRFLDATNWVPAEPLHPLADGHRVIAEKLAPYLAEMLG